MLKYTYDDINIIGDNERVSNAFGKECYYGYSAKEVLDNALNDKCKFILRQVDMDNPKPFGDISNRWYPFMIVKKEEQKPGYVPFKNVSEFIGAYRKVEAIQLKKENFYLSIRGIWLKYKATDARLMVTEMWGNGLIIGSDNAVTRWNELLKYYEFLDGTPCGILEGTTICNIEDSKAVTTVSSKSV